MGLYYFRMNILQTELIITSGIIKDDVAEHLLAKDGVPKSLIYNFVRPELAANNLISGKIDLWAFEEIGAKIMLKQAGADPDKYEIVYTMKGGLAGYYGFSKDIADGIIAKFQKSLDKLIRRGTVHEIIRFYTD